MPKLHLSPLLETFRIRDKRALIIPFRPNWAQRQIISKVESDYAEGKPTRIIICKARQVGVSTGCEGIIFAMSLVFPNTNGVVVAHRADSSEHLFGITKLMYETWPYREEYPVRYATRRELTLEHQRSSIRVMTADKVDIGRGRTLNLLHCSELAMWRSPLETMLGFAPSVPERAGTAIFVESTAKGVGNYFEEMWLDAKKGASHYTPMFFPWFKHYEYLPCLGLCEDGSCEICQKATKGFRIKGEEEKRLKRLGATEAHLVWRRHALGSLCNGDEDYFRQEFPATDTECFLASGVNAFNPGLLESVFVRERPGVGRLVRSTTPGKVDWVDDPKGPIRMYRKPGDPRWGKYFIGADCAFGTQDGDLAAAQVISRDRKEQVAVWHGRINPIAFAEELAMLGTFYNQAIIAPDVMGPGGMTVGSLTHIYPHIWSHRAVDRWPGQDRGKALGFLATWQRKQWMIAKLAELIERDQITIHDLPTYRELRAYAFYGAKGWGDVFGPATRDAHDDLVTSLAIAVLCEGQEDPAEPYETREPGDVEPRFAMALANPLEPVREDDWGTD